MSTKPDLAKLWAPADMEAEEYMQLMSASARKGTRRFQFSGTALRSCRRRTCGTPSAALSGPHTS
ncbi:hypothetical protein ABCR94_28085 [Streptomyces sp. 21So2-11]|uniref:hypothetical protein n=1 Tax=Streptomyces sp. 21So2-11 TaxID=3144408 RepID=UPI003219DC56